MPEARSTPIATDGQPGPDTPVAIVAGRGDLPKRLAEARQKAGLPSVLVVFPGCEEAWMERYPVQHHEFERAGALFRGLRDAEITHVVFAGAMNRPKLRPWRSDLAAIGIFLRALRLLGQGDDAMLRGFGRIFEERGFALIGVEEILGDRLHAKPGALGKLGPDSRALADAARAAEIVTALGPLDVGQGAVVAGGLCLGIETLGGTDHMLKSVAQLPVDRRSAVPAGTGVLFKAAKPGQDRRMDVPAIGPETVEAVAAAGLGGIVVLAGDAMVLDPEATRAAADRLGVFVYGARPDELRTGAEA